MSISFKKCAGIISISGPKAKIYEAARLHEMAFLLDKYARNHSIPSTLHKMSISSITNALNFRDKDDVIYEYSADDDMLMHAVFVANDVRHVTPQVSHDLCVARGRLHI